MYRYPDPSPWLYVLAGSPLIIPVAASFIFGAGATSHQSWIYFYLFLPFLLAAVFIAYKGGLFFRKRTLLLNECGVFLERDGQVKTAVRWEEISAVAENPQALGYGEIVIQSYNYRSISVPRSIERFSDLAFQLRKKVPEKFKVNMYLGLSNF